MAAAAPDAAPAPRSRRRPAPGRWLPLLILLVGAVGSVALALQWKKTIDGRADGQFDTAVRESTAAVGSEFQRTEDALRRIRGLFASSDRVESPEFRAYVGSLKMEERFPSIRAIAFTSAVPTRSLAQFVAAQRRDGETRFTITTAPQSDPTLRGAMQRRIVTYVAPPAGDAGRPGLDVTGRRGPRVAHDLATDTGQAADSPKLNLVANGNDPGVSTALAVYRRGAPIATVAQRRAAVRGWVIARVSGQRFAAGVRTPRARRLGVEIFDGAGTNERALLARVPRHLPDGTRTETRTVTGGGRTWTLRYTVLAGASRTSGLEPLAVLLVGLLLSALLAALVRTQMAARERADREVFERTAELRRTAAALYTVNTELEAHNREVEAFARRQRDFVATASHELRTPLTSILGYLELVLGARREDLRDEERGYLQIVYRSGQRLLAIVNDLLTVDRTDAGAMEIRPAETTMEALLAPAVETFGGACRAKGLTLTVDTPPAPVAVRVDAERMQQVLANIVGNAVKVTPAPARSASACAPPATAPSCASPTPAPASRPPSCPTSSTASTAPRPACARRRRAPASASRSRARSSRRTAAPSRSRASWAPGRRSSCRFRPSPRSLPERGRKFSARAALRLASEPSRACTPDAATGVRRKTDDG